MAIAATAAIGLGAVGLMQGTWAVGGSDSACYGLMAKAMAHGQLQPSSPLAERVPWHDGAASLVPAGFVPSPVRADAASPVCAPGFSLLLVPFVWVVGLDGIFWMTPVAGVLLVWLAFLLGRYLAGSWAGAVAALLIATSPIVVYQVLQPMSDLTCATLWLAVVVAASGPGRRRRAAIWIAGALTGLALVVRPNQLPAAAMAGLVIPALHASRPKSLTSWLAGAAMFAAAALPGLAIIASLNAELYGSPVKFGYGNLGQLFSIGFISANLTRYPRWLIESHTIFPLLSLAAPFACRRDRRGVIGLALGIAAATFGVYLVYRPFDDWWYLRFLLPAVVLALVLSAAALTTLAERFHSRAAVALSCVIVAALVAFDVRAAVQGSAFKLRGYEQRFRDTGLLVRDRFPANAVFLAAWQSGTVRFFAGREVILWGYLDALGLEPALAWLEKSDYRPYILVERSEEAQFRDHFEKGSRVGRLDWPPAYDIDREARIFDPADRDRYFAGEGRRTEYVWGKGRR